MCGVMVKLAADAAEPYDQNRLAAKLVLALRRVTDHAAPVLRRLIVAPGVELAREGQDQGDGVLRDGPCVDPLGAGETHTQLAETVLVVLVRPGADRLHELEPRGAVEQLIAPKAGCQDDIGLMRFRLELVHRAHLEIADACAASGERLAHAIGDMRKADDKVGAAGERYVHLHIPWWREGRCEIDGATMHRDHGRRQSQATVTWASDE